MTSWTLSRTLSRSSLPSRVPSRCPAPWTSRTSSTTSCRCLRTIRLWRHSSNTDASDLAWALLVSPPLNRGKVHSDQRPSNRTFLFLSLDFRPGQPGRGLPVRSVSVELNVSPQQPSLQYPIRTTSPYTLMQQQQQGMMGGQGMMANQAGMVSGGNYFI